MTISKAIDPARVGLSKSLMTSPCERKGWFGESVRDDAGRRLSFPFPERVTFGSAVDEAVAYMIWKDRDGNDWTMDDALAVGLARAREQSGWPLVEDPETFDIQVANAINLYVKSTDGLARIRALYGENLRLQGNDGQSLRAGDVIGTPDFLTDKRVIDLKTWGRLDGPKKAWHSPELGIYAYLFAAESGAVPETVAYQAYIRVTKPYWTWIEVPGTPALVAYGRETAAHWRSLIELGRAELFPVDTKFCGDCPFRAPMPDYGFEGCSVGALAPEEEVA